MPANAQEACPQPRSRRPLSAEHRQKLSAARKSLWEDPEYRAQVTSKISAKWQDPQYRARVSQGVSQSPRSRRSSEQPMPRSLGSSVAAVRSSSAAAPSGRGSGSAAKSKSHRANLAASARRRHRVLRVMAAAEDVAELGVLPTPPPLAPGQSLQEAAGEPAHSAFYLLPALPC